MALIVEDGSGLSNADSYVSAADCNTYAVNMGLAFSLSDAAAADAALRRATQFIDNRYRFRFAGYRLKWRGRVDAQALEWPRYGATDVWGYFIGPNTMPVELIKGTCEGAVRELAKPGILMPDLKRGGAVKRYKADTVEIEYGDNASPSTVFETI